MGKSRRDTIKMRSSRRMPFMFGGDETDDKISQLRTYYGDPLSHEQQVKIKEIILGVQNANSDLTSPAQTVVENINKSLKEFNAKYNTLAFLYTFSENPYDKVKEEPEFIKENDSIIKTQKNPIILDYYMFNPKCNTEKYDCKYITIFLEKDGTIGDGRWKYYPNYNDADDYIKYTPSQFGIFGGRKIRSKSVRKSNRKSSKKARRKTSRK